MTHLTLALNITETPPEGCRGILWPKSPDTHFQRTLSVSHDKLSDHHLLAINAAQEAFFRPHSSNAFMPSFEYQLQLGNFAPAADHFTLNQTSHLALTEDVYICIGNILESGYKNSRQFIEEVVNGLAEHFQYLHHDDELNRAELVCTHLQGDCLDINTVLMKILKTQSIASAYYIGLYSEAPGYRPQNDWHCWVSTDVIGVEDWDIAHHIKRGLKKVKPALNPVPGLRCALSHSRGLQFLIDGTTYEFSHLGSPFWCMSNGTVRQAAFEAQLSPVFHRETSTC